jgi:hypothetical protein
MSRTSEERAQAARDREKATARANRDFRTGNLGIDVPSLAGQTGKILSKGPVVPDYRPVVRQPTSAAPIDFRRETPSPSRARENAPASRSEAQVKPPRQPWFPFVDKWLASRPKRVFWMLGLVGLICGFGYGLSTTGDLAAAVGIALLAGFAGLVSIHVLAQIFKLALVVLGLAMGVGIGLSILLLFFYVLSRL